MIIIKLCRLVVVLAFRIFTSRPILFGFNLTERCTCRCPSCFWVEELAERVGVSAQQAISQLKVLGQNLELSDEKVIAFFRQRAHEGYASTFILGGEPYLRPELLRKLAGIIPFTAVITSVNLPEGQHLQRIPKMLHFVSFDSVAGPKHDSMRGSPGLSNKILQELALARRGGGFPVIIHVVFDKRNYMETEDILRFWKDNGLADGVVFSCMTPNSRLQDAFRLTDDHRWRIVEDLTRMKSLKEFGDFIMVSWGAIEDMAPQRIHAQTEVTCPTVRLSKSYDGLGRPIRRCIFGEKGECAECGCIVTMQFGGLTRWRGWSNLLSDLRVGYNFGRIFLQSYR